MHCFSTCFYLDSSTRVFKIQFTSAHFVALPFLSWKPVKSGCYFVPIGHIFKIEFPYCTSVQQNMCTWVFRTLERLHLDLVLLYTCIA